MVTADMILGHNALVCLYDTIELLTNPYTLLVDKVEDARSMSETALDELTNTPPIIKRCLKKLRRHLGNVEVDINGGMLDPVQSTQGMDEFTAV